MSYIYAGPFLGEYHVQNEDSKDAGINAIIVHHDTAIANAYRNNLLLRGKRSLIFSDKTAALHYLGRNQSVTTVCIGGLELSLLDGITQLRNSAPTHRVNIKRASR